MKLSPAKFLSSSYTPAGAVLLISASEDCAPFSYTAVSYFNERFFHGSVKHKYICDRYFNFTIIQEVIDAGSLFGDHNLIVVDCKSKPNSEQQQQLIKLIGRLKAEDFLIFSCDKLDRKDANSEWVSAFSSNGDWLAISDEKSEAVSWCSYLLNIHQLTINQDALELLLEMNHNNPAQLLQETEKLGLLFPSQHLITLAECQESLISNVQFNIFALSDAYLRGNLNLVLEIFPTLCQNSDEAILLMWNFGEDLRKLITIKNNLRSSSNFRLAIEGVRIWGSGISAFEEANRRLMYNRLLAYLTELAEIDCVLKGVTSGDAFEKLERLIINFCKGDAI